MVATNRSVARNQSAVHVKSIVLILKLIQYQGSLVHLYGFDYHYGFASADFALNSRGNVSAYHSKSIIIRLCNSQILCFLANQITNNHGLYQAVYQGLSL